MPYSPYLVYGYVYNSKGQIETSAELTFITSVGRRTITSDSDGIYLIDLANIGYVSGETVTLNIYEKFNNEYFETSFVVSGLSLELDFNLILRTIAVSATDYSPKTILHSAGKKPITDDNPLPIWDRSDLLKEYVLSGGDDENRIYGYITKRGAWYIQKYDDSDKTYKYVKGSGNFSSNWTNRISLTYDFFNEVFG